MCDCLACGVDISCYLSFKNGSNADKQFPYETSKLFIRIFPHRRVKLKAIPLIVFFCISEQLHLPICELS